MSWRACDRFESLSRSHSQASSRAGRPKVLRNGLSILPSGICVARAPWGRPSNAVVVPVTVEQLVVGGWVGVAKVVHRLDDPASQQVEPDPIDQAPCEEGVFLAGEPRRQADAAVRLDVFEYRPAESLRLHHLPGAWLTDVAGMVPVDDLFARLIALLAANLGEEGGEAVIIILGPALEGMVVALRTLDAHSQKELGGRLDGTLRVAADPVVVGGGVRIGRAVGGQEHADKPVHRHFPLECRANPAVEHVGYLWLDQTAVGPEDVGELKRPEVVELGPA